MAAIEAITTAMLAGVAGGRCYPMQRPQAGTLPAVAWTIISNRPQPTFNQSAGPQLWTARVQMDCIAANYAGLKALVDEVRNAAHLQSGNIGGHVVVHALVDQINTEARDQDAEIYTQPIDVVVTFYD